MTAEAVALDDWKRAVREHVRACIDDIHPAGVCALSRWTTELLDTDDPIEAYRLSQMIAEKMDLERRWAAE